MPRSKSPIPQHRLPELLSRRPLEGLYYLDQPRTVTEIADQNDMPLGRIHLEGRLALPSAAITACKHVVRFVAFRPSRIVPQAESIAQIQGSHRYSAPQRTQQQVQPGFQTHRTEIHRELTPSAPNKKALNKPLNTQVADYYLLINCNSEDICSYIGIDPRRIEQFPVKAVVSRPNRNIGSQKIAV